MAGHETDRRSGPRGAHWALVVGLLWLLLLTRAHHPRQMPVFVDESLHIMRGQVVWSFSDLDESLTPKKLLFYYWIGLFDLNAPESLWLARVATALAALPGAALTYTLARQLFDRQAGLLALALYALSPFMLFFERMALADAFTAIFCTALAVAGIGLARRPSVRRGLVVGGLGGLAALAKLTALPMLLLPLLALRLFGANRRITRITRPPYRQPLAAALLAGVVLVAAPLVFITQRTLTGTVDNVTVEESLYVTDDRSTQVLANLEHAVQTWRTLGGIPLLVLVGGAVVYLAWRRPRTMVYLLAGVLLSSGVMVLLAARFSSRYLVLGVPPVLVLVAGAVIDLTRAAGLRRRPATDTPSRVRQALVLVAWGLLVVWGVNALSWVRTAWTDPWRLPLSSEDRQEYITSTASGYALRSLAADLPLLPPDDTGRIPVIGFVPACHALPLYWTTPNAVDLYCPLFKWDTSQQQSMYDHLVAQAEAHPALYMTVDATEVFPLDDLPFEWTLLGTYPRPFEGKTVRLYRIAMAR